jgi:hypothetical protein
VHFHFRKTRTRAKNTQLSPESSNRPRVMTSIVTHFCYARPSTLCVQNKSKMNVVSNLSRPFDSGIIGSLEPVQYSVPFFTMYGWDYAEHIFSRFCQLEITLLSRVLIKKNPKPKFSYFESCYRQKDLRMNFLTVLSLPSNPWHIKRYGATQTLSSLLRSTLLSIIEGTTATAGVFKQWWWSAATSLRKGDIEGNGEGD